jgi:hypothetical protein
MGAAGGKPKLKRSMRVATLFTGVAAATVGMTQMANAQDAGQPAHKATTKQMGRQALPESVKVGSIQYSQGCYLNGHRVQRSQKLEL